MSKFRQLGLTCALTFAAATVLTACNPPPTAEIGTCLSSADLESLEVDSLNPIECTSAHDLEVFAKEDLPDGDFPGEDAIFAAADGLCEDAFADYVGTDYWESELDFTYLYPIESSWAVGDREILCMIYSPTDVTSSLKNSNR